MSKNKTIILGIDPGLADTGFGLIARSLSGLEFVDAGSIQTKKNMPFSERLIEIYQSLDKLIKKYQPDLVAIEKLYFAKNVKTALDVSQVRGAILLVAIQNKRKVAEFTPLQVKQTIATSGAATKQQVGLMVKTILGLKAVPRPDDVADALAIAITAAFTNYRLVAKK